MKMHAYFLFSIVILGGTNLVYSMDDKSIDEFTVLSNFFRYRRELKERCLYPCMAGNTEKCEEVRRELAKYHANEMQEVSIAKELVGEKGIESKDQALKISRHLDKIRYEDSSSYYCFECEQCSNMFTGLGRLNPRNADLCGTFVRTRLESQIRELHKKESLALKKLIAITNPPKN